MKKYQKVSKSTNDYKGDHTKYKKYPKVAAKTQKCSPEEGGGDRQHIPAQQGERLSWEVFIRPRPQVHRFLVLWSKKSIEKRQNCCNKNYSWLLMLSLFTRSQKALRASTSSRRPFRSAGLLPLRPEVVWPTFMLWCYICLVVFCKGGEEEEKE